MASVALSTKAVGSTVKLKIGGTLRDFIVVHQGKPGTMYDASCDGVWLLMKDCYEAKRWHSSNVNDYANSEIHSYLNSTFLGLFDANIQAQIKQAKLPYRAGSGYSTTVTSGANGLSAKIFLLSGTEAGLVHSYTPANEGAVLSYFNGCAANAADSKRVANLNGSAAIWWLRSPCCGSSHGAAFALYVYTNGNAGFGIQLCDVAQVSDGSGYGSEIPLSQVIAAAPTDTTAENTVPAELSQKDTVSDEPVEAPVEPAAAPVENEGTHQEPAAPTPAEDVTPAPAAEESALQSVMPAGGTPAEESNVTPLPITPQIEATAPAESEEPAEHTEPTDGTVAQSSYTEDMTVEELCERMTMEDARNILVPLGTCKGWTLGQVFDRRTTSLRWYMVGCQEASNVLKAGATLLWNARQTQKAG